MWLLHNEGVGQQFKEANTDSIVSFGKMKKKEKEGWDR